ncbi:hypothetical protein [Streptomyces sp. NBC_00207]|uniref:hypothetical protein n=1 Tax=unclassified Streptomyces TaxID=2593676 RepID=UPI002888016C|nr:hypothetical protein [Streptomyces sp. DSM 41633]
MTDGAVQVGGTSSQRGPLFLSRSAAAHAVGISAGTAVMVLGLVVTPEVVPEVAIGRAQVAAVAAAPGTANPKGRLPVTALAAIGVYAGCAVRICWGRPLKA